MSSVRENLIAAKALIDTPEKWLRGAFHDGRKSCFCIAGAVREVCGKWDSTPEWEALQQAMPHEYRAYTPVFMNDRQGSHEDIMGLFDRAIAAQDEVA